MVDDGSTDKTPEVLAAYAERVRVIRQPNGGLVSAVDTGLNVRAASTSRSSTPTTNGLVTASFATRRSSMRTPMSGSSTVTWRSSTPTGPLFNRRSSRAHASSRRTGASSAASWPRTSSPAERRPCAPPCSLHSIQSRPMPPTRTGGWRLVASVADIVHDRGISNRYRFHGANMGLGAGPEEMPAVHRRELPWRRWMMWNLIQDPTVTLEDLARVLQTWGIALRAAASPEPAGSRSLIPVDAEQASALVQRLDRSTPDEGLAKALLCAFSKNPFDGALAVDLEVALSRGGLPPEIPPPLISLETRSSVTIASLDEILRNPALLSAFGEEARRDSDGTLVVLFSPASTCRGSSSSSTASASRRMSAATSSRFQSPPPPRRAPCSRREHPHD